MYLFDQAPYEAAGLVDELPFGFLRSGYVVDNIEEIIVKMRDPYRVRRISRLDPDCLRTPTIEVLVQSLLPDRHSGKQPAGLTSVLVRRTEATETRESVLDPDGSRSVTRCESNRATYLSSRRSYGHDQHESRRFRPRFAHAKSLRTRSRGRRPG